MSGLAAWLDSCTSLHANPQLLKKSRSCAGPRPEEGVPDEAMSRLPSATVRVLEGLPSIDGKKVPNHAHSMQYRENLLFFSTLASRI